MRVDGKIQDGGGTAAPAFPTALVVGSEAVARLAAEALRSVAGLRLERARSAAEASPPSRAPYLLLLTDRALTEEELARLRRFDGSDWETPTLSVSAGDESVILRGACAHYPLPSATPLLTAQVSFYLRLFAVHAPALRGEEP